MKEIKILLKKKNSILSIFFICMLCTAGYYALAQGFKQNPLTNVTPIKSFFRDDFNNLDYWKPLYFPKIKRHSDYSILPMGPGSVLKAESNDSASALVYVNTFNVYEYPKVRWSWKVDNIYTNADIRTKAGDDFPIRVYITFKYDPKRITGGEQVKYTIARLLYGEYPPDSSLDYVWSSKKYDEQIMTSSYTDRSKMILLEKGSDKVGQWLLEGVNVLDDYRKAFGTEPPATASIAIMSDSDNTHESATAYIDYIEVFK